MLDRIKTLNVLPRWIIVFIDMLIFGLAAFLGYLLRLNFVLEEMYFFNFMRGVLIFTVCGLLSSVITRSFAGIIRYTGLQDTLKVLYASFLTLAMSALINSMSPTFPSILPYSVSTIAFFVALVALISYRLMVKELFAFYRTIPKQQKHILIFGAGESGMITKQLISGDSTQNIKVIGFLEDNPRKVGNVLSGVKIYSARNEFEKVVLKNSPSEVIIAASNVSIERKNELVDQCLQFGIKITTVPSTDKWIGGEFDIHQIHELKIEDLLGRNAIILKNKYVGEELNNKCILVTGAAGSIGSELVRQIIKYNPAKLVMLDQSETGLFEVENEIRGLKNMGERLICFVGDITDATRLQSLFNEHRPEYVFHAAAYKHVPMMELNVPEAISCNIMGTKNLADFSVEYNVKKFVMISTDKAVNPTSVMGASKRAAEIYVQSLNNLLNKLNNDSTKFITTRFGNVLGSNGSVIPIFKKQIKAGGPITVTHPDITRYFMTIPEAVSLVLEAGVMGQGGEIFVFDMGTSVRIVDLAKRMIQLSGLRVGTDIEITFTGLRPGEKLYEELLSDAEDNMATHHPKIMIAGVREMEFSIVKELISAMKGLLDQDKIIDHGSEVELIINLKKLIPEYKSNASEYAVLDKQTQ